MKSFISHIVLFLSLLSCGDEYNDISTQVLPQSEDVSLNVILDRNDVIWSFEFLPDQQIIFTERSGNILIFNPQTGTTTPVTGVPEIATGGEGGLLDLRLHPEFGSNHLIYFCYSEGVPGGRTQALGRAELQGTNLVNFEKIFSAGNPNSAPNHFGCRIEFTGNNQLFLSLGEQAMSAQAQDPAIFQGKILRMNADGSNVEIYSLGHRNPQGLAFDPSSGLLYSSEHGPTGGDELNIITQGSNYGWPLVTQGEPAGSLGRSSPGFVDPIIHWTPAIAPSGIVFHQGHLYIATLRGQHIRRLVVNGAQVQQEELLFENAGLRFRTLRVGPDGFLYASTDDGKIARITPVQ